MFDLEYNHTSQKSDIVDIRYDLTLIKYLDTVKSLKWLEFSN